MTKMNKMTNLRMEYFCGHVPPLNSAWIHWTFTLWRSMVVWWLRFKVIICGAGALQLARKSRKPSRHWDLGWGQFQDTLRRLEKRPPGSPPRAQTDSGFDANCSKKNYWFVKKWTEIKLTKSQIHTKVSIKNQQWLSLSQADRYRDLLIERQ